MGRLRRSHRRRNGSRLDECRVSQRRRVQESRRGAQSESRANDRRAPAVKPLALLAAGGVLAAGGLLSARATDATHAASYAATTSLTGSVRFASDAIVDAPGVAFPARRFARLGDAARFHQGLPGQRLPAEPRRQFGAGITGSFEGWFYNEDGSRTFLVGYLNRNTAQELEIPIGPDNRFEPGGPDMGQ